MKKLFSLLLCLSAGLQLNAQTACPAQTVFINEIYNFNQSGQYQDAEFVEIVVASDGGSGTGFVDMTNWVLDDNNSNGGGIGNEPGHIYFTGCFSNMPVGSVILIYSPDNVPTGINTSNDGFPNTNGVYQLPINDPCIKMCESQPNQTDPNYLCDYPVPSGGKWGGFIPMKNQGDVMQLLDASHNLVHSIYWCIDDGNYIEAANPFSVKVPCPSAQYGVAGTAIQFLSKFDYYNQNQYSSSTNGTPGTANSFQNGIHFGTYMPPFTLPGAITEPDFFHISCEMTLPVMGDNGGIAEIEMFKGVAPFTISYTWTDPDNPGATDNFSTQSSSDLAEIYNLPAGNYEVVVTDAAGCTAECEFEVTEGNRIVCCDENCPQTIEVPAGTGTEISWTTSNGDIWDDEVDACAEAIDICNEDNVGYYVAYEANNISGTIESHFFYCEPLEVQIIAAPPLSCGENEITLTVVTNAGLGSVTWYKDDTSNTPITTSDPYSIYVEKPGTYIVVVEDENGCIAEESFVFPDSDAPTYNSYTNQLVASLQQQGYLEFDAFDQVSVSQINNLYNGPFIYSNHDIQITAGGVTYDFLDDLGEFLNNIAPTQLANSGVCAVVDYYGQDGCVASPINMPMEDVFGPTDPIWREHIVIVDDVLSFGSSGSTRIFFKMEYTPELMAAPIFPQGSQPKSSVVVEPISALIVAELTRRAVLGCTGIGVYLSFIATIELIFGYQTYIVYSLGIPFLDFSDYGTNLMASLGALDITLAFLQGAFAEQIYVAAGIAIIDILRAYYGSIYQNGQINFSAFTWDGFITAMGCQDILNAPSTIISCQLVISIGDVLSVAAGRYGANAIKVFQKHFNRPIDGTEFNLLAKKFIKRPRLINAWKVLYPDQLCRKNSTKLEKVTAYADDFGRSFDDIGSEFVNVPVLQRSGWVNHLEFRTKSNGKVNKAGNRALDYNTFNSNNNIPNKYSADSRFNENLDASNLAYDPATGNFNSKTRQEAMAGLEAESQGLVSSPISRDPTGGAEFIDGNGINWDVKGPPAQGLSTPQQIADAGIAIKDELTLTGNKVILDVTWMSDANLVDLRAWLQTNVSSSYLANIIEVNSNLF